MLGEITVPRKPLNIWSDEQFAAPYWLKKRTTQKPIESGIKRQHPLTTFSSACTHVAKCARKATTAAEPSASYKTMMCRNWLSGCYHGDRCIYAHRLEELFVPFYHKEMIDYFQANIVLEIDRAYLTRLCKSICDWQCGDPNGECLFRENTSMRNKTIELHVPSYANQMPYCTVTCNHCKISRRVDIYSFTVLDKTFA